MSLGILRLLATLYLAFLCVDGTALGQTVTQPQPPPAQTLSELQKLQAEIVGQRAGQETIKTYIEILAGIITIVSVIVILLQIITFVAETRSRRRGQEESAKQGQREEQIHERFIKLLDVTSTLAADAQRKVTALEERGVQRAGETLRLINNLLAITERAAAKAAGAQFDFLSKSIETFDGECQRLIAEATEKDDRDIVAKPEFCERVRVLTKQIESLDIQIINYNESVPRQFDTVQGDDAGTSVDWGRMHAWHRLGLTGPCLFIRGMNHHLDQNFGAAINDWKSSLNAMGASSVKVDANYWIGYVHNTLGDFDKVTPFLKEAASAAPDQRRAELTRLELETRFFALDLGQVPKSLLDEGEQFYQGLGKHRVTARAISSFATTMGNISLTKHIRDAIAKKAEFAFPEESSRWFDLALSAHPRSRWARFGICQTLVISNQLLDDSARKAVMDVIDSVNREYQNRVEDRSKVLSRITEYICMLMLGDDDQRRLSTIESSIETHASLVTARTIYSQFRKQNVQKEVFLEEYFFLRKERDLRKAFRMANSENRRLQS